MFPPLLFTWSKLCGVNEDNGDLLQKVPCMHCCTQWPQPCSRPPLTHASAGDSWTLLGKSGSVSCGVTASFSWVLVHISFCLCSPRVYFPVLLWLLLCPWTWDIFFLVASNIFLLMVVQQHVVILEFSQEKMSTRPSTPHPCPPLEGSNNVNSI